jgi:hypothetical protein
VAIAALKQNIFCSKGFSDITIIDIAPAPLAVLKKQFKNNPSIFRLF